MPTGKKIPYPITHLRNKKFDWRNTCLDLKSTFEEGYIETSKGNKVVAYRYVPNTLELNLIDNSTNILIPKPISYFKQFKIEIEYNCFGYCFADGKVHIENPTQIILDDYEEVEKKKAEIIIFKTHNGYNDDGEDIFIDWHGVKILPSGKVSFKPGINQLVKNANYENAIHNYNFNHKVFLRKSV